MAAGTIPWTNHETKQFGIAVAQNGGTRTIAVSATTFGVIFTFGGSEAKSGCYNLIVGSTGGVRITPINAASDISFNTNTNYRLTITNANSGSISVNALIFNGDMPSVVST